jgi:late competence protein required for DNA uptake (superfamily II DNA/RNA helicase)
MSAEVIPFLLIKNAEPKAKNASVNEPRYFCLKCDTDRFKLLASLRIHCANCGALMRNIAVRGYA